MAEYVRELDDTRLVTTACFVDEDDGLVLNNPLEEELDVVEINEYYGWYHRDSNEMDRFQEDSSGTPVFVPEMGPVPNGATTAGKTSSGPKSSRLDLPWTDRCDPDIHQLSGFRRGSCSIFDRRSARTGTSADTIERALSINMAERNKRSTFFGSSTNRSAASSENGQSVSDSFCGEMDWGPGSVVLPVSQRFSAGHSTNEHASDI